MRNSALGLETLLSAVPGGFWLLDSDSWPLSLNSLNSLNSSNSSPCYER
jgi:hypothetical protein